MNTYTPQQSEVELWGGPEYTINRVRSQYVDQIRLSGHDRRPDDLERFARLGLAALRYPVLWERHAPAAPDEIDLSWADERLHRLRDLQVRPIVGLLHHGSGPAYTSLLDPQFPSLFARYARVVAERYPWVAEWTPVNEPLTTARFSALYGPWFPHDSGPAPFARALVNQVRAVVEAMQEIRAVNPGARLIQTEDVGVTLGTPPVHVQIEHEQHRRWLTWDLLAGRVDRSHPMWDFLLWAGLLERDLAFFLEHPCPPDVCGLNYYVTSDRWLDHRVAVFPAYAQGGNGQIDYADVDAVRARPEGIVGHEQHLLDTWERYQIPVAITEVHLGCTREEQLRWLATAWNGATAAKARGADVRAVTAWALLGSFDWDSLVTDVRGHYEPGAFDVRGATPRQTAIAEALRNLADGKPIQHPVAHAEGWWDRQQRVAWGAAGESAGAAGTSIPPIVVFGGRGTLGRAFERICALRGLPVHIVTRREADITDAAAVDAILRRVQPWAVVNAAGYVRVDDAEREGEACWRDNVTGPLTLAAACRRRSLPLAMFSSDLVFDGTVSRPYLETDDPRPLNAYGRAKAEAERRVLDLLPEALVVRTSAFFGPWDEANFAAHAWAALSDGRPFDAPDDYIVSPTYVPHLVDGVLDLLIDRESGIWHLANAGALTWCDFARAIANAGGLRSDLVRPAALLSIWGPAPRPSYSPLSTMRGQILPSLDDGIRAYVRHKSEAAEPNRATS